MAASRAVRTGFNQAVSKISDANAEKLHAECFEVSEHLTARPSHAVWQGKVYSREQLVEVCGLGTGPGLPGWNCRHSYYPFIPVISKRTYTDEQLEEIYKKSTETTEWRGKEYTGYEATQYQRALERRMRVQDEKIRLMKPAGVDSNEIAAMKAKRAATYQEYKQFSEKMGLPEQMNRVFNSEVKSSKKTGEISTGGSSDSSPVSSSPSVMHYITPGSKKSLWWQRKRVEFQGQLILQMSGNRSGKLKPRNARNTRELLKWMELPIRSMEKMFYMTMTITKSTLVTSLLRSMEKISSMFRESTNRMA